MEICQRLHGSTERRDSGDMGRDKRDGGERNYTNSAVKTQQK